VQLPRRAFVGLDCSSRTLLDVFILCDVGDKCHGKLISCAYNPVIINTYLYVFLFALVCVSSECCGYEVGGPVSSCKSTEDCTLDVEHPDGDSNVMNSRFVLYKICTDLFFFSVRLVIETRHCVGLVEETA
jgi:hypothetical protein